MTAYYNEIDPFAAEWLRELIKNGLIAPGDVDERSIEDVAPSDLTGYTQCHFFAGIAGWSYALRLAGWTDDRPVWTGSCPCQPFSSAGKGKGFDDERHLWPAFLWHISQCKPSVVFGEQVAGRNGEVWLDTVSTDLEAEDYTVGATVLGACGVGAPHIRKRLYWVGHTDSYRCKKGGETAEAMGYRCTPHSTSWDDCIWIKCSTGVRRPIEPGCQPLVAGFPSRVEQLRCYGNAIVPQVAAEFIKAFKAHESNLWD